MKTLKQLKQGDTEVFRKDLELIHLFHEHGRFFIVHKRSTSQNLLSFNTLTEARKEFKTRVAHLKKTEPIVNIYGDL